MAKGRIFISDALDQDGNMGLGIYYDGLNLSEGFNLTDLLVKGCNLREDKSVDFNKMAVPSLILAEPRTDASKEKIRATLVCSLNKLKKEKPNLFKKDIAIIVNK